MTAIVRLTCCRVLPDIATLVPASSVVAANSTTSTLPSLSPRRHQPQISAAESRHFRSYATKAKSPRQLGDVSSSSSSSKEGTAKNLATDDVNELRLPFELDGFFTDDEAGMVEKRVEDDDDEPIGGTVIGGGMLHKEISAASTIEELFSVIKGRRLQDWHHVHFLGRITKLLQDPECKTEPSTILNREDYFHNLIYMDYRVTKVKTHVVTGVLRHLNDHVSIIPGLRKIDLFVKVMESYENECSWRFREMELKEVVALMILYAPMGEKAPQSCLKEAAVGQLDLRWTELDAKMIIDLLYHLKELPETLQHHLETRVFELVESLSAKQLVVILGLLSQSGKANIQLVKTICFHLSKNDEVFSFEQVSKVAFYLASISFLSYPLLEKMCRDLRNSELATVPSMVDAFQLSSLLASLGKLRWRDPVILEVLSNILLAKCNVEDCDTKELNPALQNALKTLSHLSFSPKSLPQLSSHLLRGVEESSSSQGVISRIDGALSLSQLGIATPEHLDALFSAIDDDEGLSRLPKASLARLLQVNSYAAINGLGSRPLRLPPLPLLSPPPPPPPPPSSTTKPQSKDNVAELGRMERFRSDFRQFFPAAKVKVPSSSSSSKYLVDGPWLHPSGHVVDIVVVVDGRGNTLPVPDALVEALTLSSSTDASAENLSISSCLPPDAHAVAILLLDVFDFTAYSETPVGEKVNAARDLSALGFKPCLVKLRQFYAESKGKRTEFINKIVLGALEPAS